jgi:predicted DNA-binding protein (MmcQ/YjbR family)
VPYALFEVESAEGAFVDRVRQEAENLVRDVVENCFFDSDVRSRLLSYVKERYGTEQENLRVIYKDYCTLREHGTKKWYGLFMRIPWTSLHVERKGMTKVLNVKADPEEIQRLIDHDRYFPAYHMDKVHWISILLDKETDMDAAKRMLDESYALVEKSGRKGRRKVKK